MSTPPPFGNAAPSTARGFLAAERCKQQKRTPKHWQESMFKEYSLQLRDVFLHPDKHLWPRSYTPEGWGDTQRELDKLHEWPEEV